LAAESCLDKDRREGQLGRKRTVVSSRREGRIIGERRKKVVSALQVGLSQGNEGGLKC